MTSEGRPWRAWVQAFGDARGSRRHEGKVREVRTIGEAAAELGTEAHVLGHWEQVGARSVRRDGNGYRVFDDGAFEQARTGLRLRGVGLSLPEVIAAIGVVRAVGVSTSAGSPGVCRTPG
ncbi:MerR family transcriptional regulator [Streptomyces sp. NPDC058330]|uniref:MerR family transcriptional regulator n=1 Tax=Streptomyces sp. NPDC058330 TaxID=3346449 RepID=UPI0036E4D33E